MDTHVSMRSMFPVARPRPALSDPAHQAYLGLRAEP